MADWPSSLGDGQLTTSYTASPTPASITAPATIHTKIVTGTTAFAQLVAATPYDITGITVTIAPNSSGTFLLDIAVGPALSEVVVIPNIITVAWATDTLSNEVYFPIGLPAGSRISGRAQSSTVSGIVRVGVRVHSGGSLGATPRGIVQAIGAVAVSTQTSGTITSAGPTANTWTAWKVFATDAAGVVFDLPSYPIEQLIPATHNVSTVSNSILMMEVGIGPTGAEQTILQITNAIQAQQRMGTTYHGPYPCSIPAGTQIQMRTRTSVVSSSILSTVLYGVS